MTIKSESGGEMKNIVICADLREESLNSLKKIKDKLKLEGTVVHLVHAFEIQVGMMEFAAVVYPTASQYPDIENSVLSILENLRKDLSIDESNTQKYCFFTPSKEKTIKDFLDNIKADLVVISTRGKHGIDGFFASSFADFLTKYSPCDVLVIRP